MPDRNPTGCLVRRLVGRCGLRYWRDIFRDVGKEFSGKVGKEIGTEAGYRCRMEAV